MFNPLFIKNIICFVITYFYFQTFYSSFTCVLFFFRRYCLFSLVLKCAIKADTPFWNSIFNFLNELLLEKNKITDKSFLFLNISRRYTRMEAWWLKCAWMQIAMKVTKLYYHGYTPYLPIYLFFVNFILININIRYKCCRPVTTHNNFSCDKYCY